jgi:antitoxin (DNA-binding transcriptional repressor) of toxin-antitoxin stability system
MARTATVRDLRNHFPRVRELLEREGEVIVTEQGEPRYRLTRYGRRRSGSPPPKDYLARLRRHQPRPMTAAAARRLRDVNRGER